MKDLGISSGNQNRAFHKRASHGKMGAPKDTSMGKDLSPKATNTMGQKLQRSPISPSANANSRNGG